MVDSASSRINFDFSWTLLLSLRRKTRQRNRKDARDFGRHQSWSSRLPKKRVHSAIHVRRRHLCSAANLPANPNMDWYPAEQRLVSVGVPFWLIILRTGRILRLKHSNQSKRESSEWRKARLEQSVSNWVPWR